MKITFLGLPDAENARVALLPIPYEQTTSWLKGTCFAPIEILKTSPYLEFFDEETGIQPHEELGFFTYPIEEFPQDAEKALLKIRSLVRDAQQRGFLPILLGGEHTITLGAVSALKEIFPELKILHLDAHLDFREEYLGNRFSHATVFRRIHEMGIPFVSLGIRALSKEEYEEAKNRNIPVYFAHEVWNDFGRVLGELEEFLSDGLVYISLDMDVLDPSLAPGVGTPEPGGLSWRELLQILRRCARAKVIGMDIVETKPIPHYPFTEFLVGKIILKFCAYLVDVMKNEFLS